MFFVELSDEGRVRSSDERWCGPRADVKLSEVERKERSDCILQPNIQNATRDI